MPGKYFEELEVGAVLKHKLGRTITEMDNVLFTTLTMNPQPLHLNEEVAGQSQFGRRIVNGIFTLGLATGLTVADLTDGTLVANLGYETVKHPHPMFHGDTLYVETEVLEKRESRSKPDRGIVRFRHTGRNQAGTVVVEFERTALMLKKNAASAEKARAMTAEPKFIPRRAMLFMPGDSLRKISKAAQLDVDSIVMDLEDGVALSQKAAARETVREAFQTLDFGRSERLIRLNPPDTELFQADLAATLPLRPDGFVIPKVETAEHLATVARRLTAAAEAHGWPAMSIKLLAVVETAKGIVNLKEIAGATPRLAALMFGAEDLAGDMGAQRTLAGWEVFYARSALVTTAAAFNLQAIDMISTDLSDTEALRAECLLARQLGYDGKMAIHPRQVEVIHQAFAPSPEEIDRARRLIQAHEEHQAAGTGAFNFEGKMVDMPLIRAAEHVLAQARVAGLLNENRKWE